MKDKAESVLNKLRSSFPGRTVKHRFTNELHEFYIEEDKTTYHLYIDRDYMDDLDKDELIELIDSYRITDKFKGPEKSRWLYIYDTGVRDVDENFAE